MATEQIGDYEIEYAGVKLPDADGWGAYVTVYGPPTNPMHRNCILPMQRVAVEHVFASEDEATAEAHRAALGMLEHR